MQPIIPDHALRYGLLLTPTGFFTSKTLMYPELSLLLDASPEDADFSELRELALDENVLLKQTVKNRQQTFGFLSRLYSLRQDTVIFRSLRMLWSEAGSERPLLALLCAAARDVTLREVAPVVLSKDMGEPVPVSEFEDCLREIYGERYKPLSRLRLAEHLSATFTQSGHLVSRKNGARTVKCRVKPATGPASVAYALLLGYLCGARGVLLYDTFWVRVLDRTPEEVDALAFAAAQRGWLSYRRFGDVAEITFPRLLEGVNDEELGIGQ